MKLYTLSSTPLGRSNNRKDKKVDFFFLSYKWFLCWSRCVILIIFLLKDLITKFQISDWGYHTWLLNPLAFQSYGDAILSSFSESTDDQRAKSIRHPGHEVHIFILCFITAPTGVFDANTMNRKSQLKSHHSLSNSKH